MPAIKGISFVSSAHKSHRRTVPNMRCFVLLSLVALCSCTPLGLLVPGDVPMGYLQMKTFPNYMLGQQHIVNEHIQGAQQDPIAVKEEILSEQPINQVGDDDVVERLTIKKPTVPLATEGLFGRQGVKVGNTILKTPTLGETYTMGQMGYPTPLVLKEQVLNEIPVGQMGGMQIVDRLVMEKAVIPAQHQNMYGVSGIKVGSTVVKTPSMDYYQAPFGGMGGIWGLLAHQKMMMQYPQMMMMMQQQPQMMMMQYPELMMHYNQIAMQYPHMMTMMMKHPMLMKGFSGQSDYPFTYGQNLLGHQY